MCGAAGVEQQVWISLPTSLPPSRICPCAPCAHNGMPLPPSPPSPHSGFLLAFVKGWDMTLVMLGCIPLMGVAGALAAKLTAKAAAKENAAYARASAIAQQSIGQIRTVAAYTQV